ncbi:hypothetical protein OAA03_00250 [bacterium]|nr:hypothetical protein [bacterium]
MSIIKPNNNTMSSITALPSGLGGKVLQVVRAEYTGTASQAHSSGGNGNAYKLTDLTVSITPSSTSSKIFLQGRLCGAWGGNQNESVFFYYRDSTIINIHTGGSNRLQGTSPPGHGSSNFDNYGPNFCVLNTIDSPNTTSAVVYSFGFKAEGTGTFRWNRGHDDTDAAYSERAISEIIAMEIAG